MDILSSKWTTMGSTEEQEAAIATIEKWLKKMKMTPRSGATIGKSPQTVILDLQGQDAAIYISSSGFADKMVGTSAFPGVKVYGVHIKTENDFELFKKTIEDKFAPKTANLKIANELKKIAKELITK